MSTLGVMLGGEPESSISDWRTICQVEFTLGRQSVGRGVGGRVVLVEPSLLPVPALLLSSSLSSSESRPSVRPRPRPRPRARARTVRAMVERMRSLRRRGGVGRFFGGVSIAGWSCGLSLFGAVGLFVRCGMGDTRFICTMHGYDSGPASPSRVVAWRSERNRERSEV